MKALKSSGMHQPCQAEVISKDMEDTLWGKWLLGDLSPRHTCVLHRLVFRVTEWIRAPSPSLSSIAVELPNGSAHLVYKETVSKTNQRGLKQRKKVPKK